MPVIECDVEDARDRLREAGVEIIPGNTEHEHWRARTDDAEAIAYDDKVLIQGGSPEQLESKLRDDDGRVHVYSDGASRGNPGPAAIGWVLVDSSGIVTEGNKRIGQATNNQAEYEGLVQALSVASEYGFDDVEIRCDAQLIVRQVTGEWDVNDPDLREYRLQVRELLESFDDWSITHVPREVNERADELANQAFENS